MNTDNTVKQRASLFDLDGVPKMSQAIPLALQHVVAMIVGCVTPVSYTHLTLPTTSRV